MSGSFSSGLLDALAKPAQVNYLDVVDKASKAALYINEARKTQAQQLAGEAFQQSIKDGKPDQQALLTNLAAAGPGAALAAQSSAQAGQTLDQDTFMTHMSRLTSMGGAAMALASQYPNGVPQSAVNQEIDTQAQKLGMSPTDVAQAKAQFGSDPAANSATIFRNHVANLNAQQQLMATQPDIHFQPQGGSNVPVNLNPRVPAPPGVMQPQQMPVTPGPSDTVSVTDTRKTLPDGSYNPNYGQPTTQFTQDVRGGGAQPGATPTSTFKALVGTEGSGPNAVSPKGATGSAQIMPGTFNQYKLPGENYNNEDDRQAAARRAVDDLWKKYPNDPARVAVGYFSGPDNVAPPGSPTPWITDKSDGTTSTSGYVRNFTSKLGGGTKVGGPGAGQGGPQVLPTALAPGEDFKIKASTDQYTTDNAASADFQNRVFPVAQALSLLKDPDVKTGEGSEFMTRVKSFLQTRLSSLPGVDAQTVANAKQQEVGKYLTQIVNANPFAGRSDAMLASAVSGNPGAHLNNLSNEDVLKGGLALERMKQASLQAFKASGQPTWRYQDFQSEWAKNIDPRAFVMDQITDPKKADAVFASLKTPAQRQAFHNGLDAVANNPGLMNLPAMPH